MWADCSHICHLYFLNNTTLRTSTHSSTRSRTHKDTYCCRQRGHGHLWILLLLRVKSHTNIRTVFFTYNSLSGHHNSYQHLFWGQGYTRTHTHRHKRTHIHTKTFPSDTAALPIRPQVCSNSKLPHRDQSQFISVRLLVTETEALTEVKLTNLPSGKYQPAHILHLYSRELRRSLLLYRSSSSFTIRCNGEN